MPAKTYDVIIIGAGSIGTPAAYYLAKAGLKTLVLDRAASVGQGSNKRAIGGIRATHSDPAKIRICLRSIEIFSTWKEEHGDDIEWDACGYSYIAYREKEENTLKDLLKIQKSYGLNIDWLNRDDLLKIIPDLNPDGLIGGTFSPEDGSASPLLTNHAYYIHARKHQAEFRFNESVTGMDVDHNRIQWVKTANEKYSAGIVINAAGAWASAIGSLCGQNIPVRPDSHESAITEPVARFLKPMVVDIRPAPGSANFYFYQHCTGQLIFCITPSPSIWGFCTDETSTFLPMISRRMIEIMPRLSNIRVRRTWRGLYPMTPDGNPIVGWATDPSNMLLAVGMCGQGYMLGPGIGEFIARVVRNETKPGDEEILKGFSPAREFKGEEKLK
jgi:sarcosine oxidase subunit beta